MSDFYHQIGPVALGSRLRQLGERFAQYSAKVFELYDVPLDPRWFPVFQCLSMQGAMSVSDVAQYIGHSHASVSQIVREMVKAKVAISAKSRADGRVSLVNLTTYGRSLVDKLAMQSEDVEQVIEQMISQAKHNLWQAIGDMEVLLNEKDFYSRMLSQYRHRANQDVQIVPFEDKYAEAFYTLNRQWIDKHFKIEQTDLDYLEQPQQKIIQPGGEVFIALQGEEVLGTCALVRVDKNTFELAKMAVKEAARGKHIGYRLGQAVIAKAQDLGAKTLFLESNTALQSAINLYRKLGFTRVPLIPSPYDRADIRMEMHF